MKRTIALAVAVISAATSILPSVAAAEPVAISGTRPDTWEFGALVYGWYPDLGGRTTFPNGQSSDISVDASDLLDHTNMAALGSFEVRKGSWGMFTDVMYQNIGAFRSAYRNITIGDMGLPADVSASADLDIKVTIWTLAATYRVVATEDAAMDFFAGARLVDEKVNLKWTLNGNVAQVPLPGQAGRLSENNQNIDALVGLKGRLAFGTDLKWFVPYYGDIGTGDSQLTWQAMAGLGYAFSWGEIIGGYRYLDYNFKSDSRIDNLNLSGPMLGVAFHW